MIKRPSLKAKVSGKDFKENLAKLADDLAKWVELSVTAFSADPKAKAERLAKVKDPETGFQYFLETYLPHYVKGEHSLFHHAIFKRVPEILASEKGVRDLLIAPRGSSKSTHLSLGFALYCICLGYKRYILEVCDVYEQAALLVEAIKSELTENPRLSNDFPEATGAGRVWREGEIVTANNIRVEGLGAAKKIRGRRHGPYRPDLMFFDDLENDEAVRSPEQRKKLETWIKRAALKVGPPDGSMDVVWVGTVLHYDAVLVRAAKSPVWRVQEFQAVIRFPDRMDLWDRFEEIYENDGEEAATGFYTENKSVMDAGAIVNWPAVQPLLKLMLERAADHDSFATEYQNKPINEASPFKDLTFWVVREPDLVHFGSVDPSLGKKGKGRDPSAILIGGFNRLHGTMDVLEASIRRRLPDIIISDVIEMQRKYHCMLWFIEAVQFQEFLRTTLMATAAKQGVGISAVPITPTADKDLRIERLQPPVAAGLIRLNSTQQTMIDQLQQWPNADHDDGPDCLDMLWQNTLRYAGGLVSATGLDIQSATSNDARSDGWGDYRL